MTAGTATGAPVRRRPARWALPARPPEQWVGPAWSVALTLLLGAAVVVPLTGLLRAPQRTVAAVELALLGVVVACACAVAAYALLVQGNVTEDRRLTWLAGGPLLLHPGVLTLALLDPARLDGTDPLLGLAVLPLLAACGALSPPWSLLAPALVGSASVTCLLVLAEARVPALVVAVVGLALWLLRAPRTAAWGCTAGALAGVLVGFVLALSDGAEPAPDLARAAFPLGLLAIGLGLPTATGFTRQARRWRTLEQEVRDSRIPTALLPGRSVTPEDDTGLPQPPEVQQVLDTEAVVVALQPVLRLSDGQVVGQEALARFGGRIPTDRWFRGASRYGLGLELEVLCLRKALALLPTLPPPQFLAVNVSPAALADPRTLEAFASADLARVVVEVTEHEAVADYPGVRATLDRLRARGARIAVDDTGAGYASLRHVLLLQPEVVKLDTALVRDLPTDPRRRALVVALTSFAQAVGSTVLAEGIETREQLDALLAIGIDLGQGWHLGVPEVPDQEG